MFANCFADDPQIVELWGLLDACEFLEVLDRTTDLGPEPATADARSRWRELKYIHCIALVVLVRYADAEATCQQVLNSADADGDAQARVKVLGYGIASAFFLGRVEAAVARLDEVLAAAEQMQPGPAQMSTFVAAAIGSGMIGLTELSDQLMAQLVDQVMSDPAESLQPAVIQFLHALLSTRRCQLAISQEQRAPARSAELYRSVVDLHSKIGIEVKEGMPTDTGWCERILDLYLSHLCFAKIAIGESADVEKLVRSIPVTGRIEPFDTVAATTEIMWGLSQLRLALADGDFQSDNRAYWQGIAKSLTDLAQGTQTLVLQVETARVLLDIARRNNDLLLSVAVEERHEAALDEFDWTYRLERARFSGLKSNTMRLIVQARGT